MSPQSSSPKSSSCPLRHSRLALALAMAWQVGATSNVSAATEDRFVNLRGVAPRVQDIAPVRPVDGLNPDIDKLLDQPTDLWERIRLGFAMSDLDGKIVKQQEAWYAARPELVQAIFQRSRRYLHFIVEEMERQGLPTELALLPFVESGFNPLALSSAQAAGLWQFIPETGTKYKLTQSSFYDAREDVVASTSAAIEYLQFLYRFNDNDWHRALASYNWGELAVARAVDRNRVRGLGDAYSSLTMPEETRNYVPRLQAVKNIVRNPAAFGITLTELPNEPTFAVIPTTQVLDLKRAAELAEMAQDEFLALNPAFNRAQAPVAVKDGLAIPLTKVEAFKANLARYVDNLAKSVKAVVTRVRGAKPAPTARF